MSMYTDDEGCIVGGVSAEQRAHQALREMMRTD